MSDFKTLEEIRRKLQPGDLLEFNRGFYSHYALYLGNNRVMNLDAEDKGKTVAKITDESLDKVCKDSKIRVNNHTDVARRRYNIVARPVAEIIRAAREYENTSVPYKFDGRNCEYYCTLWRYNIGFSTQVASPTTSTPAGPWVAGAFLVGAGAVLMAAFTGGGRHSN